MFLPIREFLISTKFPILTFSLIKELFLIWEKGPILQLFEIIESFILEDVISQLELIFELLIITFPFKITSLPKVEFSYK